MNSSPSTSLPLTKESPFNITDLIVGRIPFLVCAPYFHDSLHGLDQVQFVDGPPSKLNELLYTGKIDCAPSSCIEYPRNAENYYIVPGISTGGRSQIKSVLFLSQVPWEELSNKNIMLSNSSSTSNILFQILCQRKYKVDPILNNEEEAVGRLAIGNDALKQSFQGGWKYCYDLAEEWYKWQGLPFCFGLWIVRKEAVEKKTTVLKNFLTHLEASTQSFLEHPNDAITKWTKEFPLDLPEALKRSFFESADYQLTQRHIKSLLLFFQLASDHGYCQPCDHLNFLPDLTEL